MGISDYIHLPTGESFTNGKLFETMANYAFKKVDVDKTGYLDVKELYIAILLLYDKVNSALPCHIDPPSRTKIYKLMSDYDIDANGRLDKKEFMKLSKASFYDSKNLGDSFLLKIAIAVILKLFIFPYTGIGAKNLLVKHIGADFMTKVPDPIMATAFETIATSINSFR